MIPSVPRRAMVGEPALVPPGRHTLARLFGLALVVVGGCGLASISAPAGEPAGARPVLGVPQAKADMALAVALPPDFRGIQGAGNCRLVEKGGGHPVPAAVVVGPGEDGSAGPGYLTAILPRLPEPRERRFGLEPAAPSAEVDTPFRFRDLDPQRIVLEEAGRPVLVYNHGVITNEKIPQSDARRSRACFVHPIYGLWGEVLTESFPRDHYHHHGLFWAWPHVRIEGKEYDLWVYNNIRQRFVRWLARQTSPVAAVLGVENGWFVDQRQVMIERIWLRVYRPAGSSRAIDVHMYFIPLGHPITLCGAEGKSYGGLNLRYAPRPQTETLITVPSGKTREDLPDTPLAWADLTARFAGAPERSGAAIFVDPAHPDFPPTWLTRHYGILCVGWPGVKPRTFAPKKPIRLNYRVWIHKYALEPEQIQEAFDAYAAACRAAWQP